MRYSTIPGARQVGFGITAVAFAAFVAAACGGGGAAKTATPALSGDEASTATVVAAATGTAEAAASARSTAAAAYAGITIKQARVLTGATPDAVSSMPTFIIRLSIDNQTGNSVRLVGEFVVHLNDGSDVRYGSYRCSKPIVIEAPEGRADFTAQACTGDRSTPLSLPDALTLAQGATLVSARLIFEGDIEGPLYTPDGALAPT